MWQPGREHIVPTPEEFCHFHTNYDPFWEETFMPEDQREPAGQKL